MRRGVVGGLASLLLFGGCGNGDAVTGDNSGGGFVLPPIINDNSTDSGNGDDNSGSQNESQRIERVFYSGIGLRNCVSDVEGTYSLEGSFYHYGYSDNGEIAFGSRGLPIINGSGEIGRDYMFSDMWEDEFGDTNRFIVEVNDVIIRDSGDVSVVWGGSESYGGIERSISIFEHFINLSSGKVGYEITGNYAGQNPENIECSQTLYRN